VAEEKRQGKINDWLDDDEYALVVKADGSFQGVFAPFEIEDFDQLPDTILVILGMIYGDQITDNATPLTNRTIH
jgi:hypothetical protein|tara:strand:+ start:348 stop:569 length:222 start_codon:yes stop_codon:yes gene_type:complete